ncbi:MFS transporter [Zoogloea sp.]|uniref:MFS transporter n=1 Tax=Zoogloea sp. TaxID=49181 RepID=UPI0035AD8057
MHSTASDTRQLLFLLTLAAFASSASFRVCDPMLPGLAGQFGASTAEVALIITGFTIAYGAMQLVYGPLGERFERFTIITRATALCAVGSVGAALAPSLELLTACRILTGVAAAGIIPMSLATVSDLIPADQRQATLARLFSGQILGMVFGQVLGGLCVDLGLWRLAFGVLTGLYLLIAFALGRQAHLGAATRGGGPSGASVASLYRTALGLLVAAETRGVMACFFVEAALVFGVLAFLPLYLHQHFGLALAQATLPLLLYGAGGLLFSFAAGRLGGRMNHRAFPVGAACLVALANVVAVVAAHPGWIFAAALLSGFGYYQLHSALLFQITQRAPAARSLALALSISLFFVGQSVGVFAAGWLVDQGQIMMVFISAALGMPLLGLAVGRQIRPT